MTPEQKLFNRLSTLQEVFDYCAEPELIEERVARLKRCSDVYPSLKQFIKVSHSLLGGFEHLLPYMEYKPVAKHPNSQEVTFEEFFRKHLPILTATAGGGSARKRSKFAVITDYLEARDYKLITAALQGEFAYENPRVNELVLKLAFPELFPNA